MREDQRVELVSGAHQGVERVDPEREAEAGVECRGAAPELRLGGLDDRVDRRLVPPPAVPDPQDAGRVSPPDRVEGALELDRGAGPGGDRQERGGEHLGARGQLHVGGLEPELGAAYVGAHARAAVRIRPACLRDRDLSEIPCQAADSDTARGPGAPWIRPRRRRSRAPTSACRRPRRRSGCARTGRAGSGPSIRERSAASASTVCSSARRRASRRAAPPVISSWIRADSLHPGVELGQLRLEQALDARVRRGRSPAPAR